MTEKEWKKLQKTPEGACLTVLAKAVFLIVVALLCAWLFPKLKQKIDKHEKDRTCVVVTTPMYWVYEYETPQGE